MLKRNHYFFLSLLGVMLVLVLIGVSAAVRSSGAALVEVPTQLLLPSVPAVVQAAAPETASQDAGSPSLPDTPDSTPLLPSTEAAAHTPTTSRLDPLPIPSSDTAIPASETLPENTVGAAVLPLPKAIVNLEGETSSTPAPMLTPQPIDERTLSDNERIVLADVRQRRVTTVIVGLNVPFVLPDQATAQAFAAQELAVQQTRQTVLSSLSAYNAEVVSQSTNWVIPFVALRIDERALRALLSSPVVTTVDPNLALSPTLSDAEPVIHAPTAWQLGYKGNGQTVAIIDTGVDAAHPFFGGRVVAEACFSGGGDAATTCINGQTAQLGAGAASPSACFSLSGSDTRCGHGTHVAGIAAGNLPYTTLSGAAPSADIIAINAASANVALYDSDIISGLNYVYLLRNSYSIAAVNMSLGGGAYPEACDALNSGMTSIIRLLKGVGIATVVSSGNSGFTGYISFPACISDAISVGATNNADAVASFSNRAFGMLDMFAPGVNIFSSVPQGSASDVGGTGYNYNSGTSMAAPFVTGAFAVYRQFAPGASVDAILNRFKTTGVPIAITGGTVPRLDIGTAVCPNFPYTVPASDTTALINAITCANDFSSNSVINLTNSTYTLTSANSIENGLPPILSTATAGTLTINGNGATITRSSAGGTPAFRIFSVQAGASLTLNNLTISGGSGVNYGGGVTNQGGTLVLNNVSVLNNSAVLAGAGIYNDSASFLTVNNSTISGNVLTSVVGNGGGLNNVGTAVINHNTISNNTASQLGGGIHNTGMLTVVETSFVNNMGVASGGAIFNSAGTAAVTNSTLFGNPVGAGQVGGGFFNSSSATARLVSSTVASNGGSIGGGIYNQGTFTIYNSALAQNGGGDCSSTGTITFNYSVVMSGACGVTHGVNGNIVLDPLLSALQGNPPYALPSVGSVAINAGNNSYASEATLGFDFTGDGDTNDTLTGDQLGLTRIAGGTMDIGAVETGATNTAPTISNITNKSTPEDTATGAIAFTVGDAEMPAASLIVSGTSSNTTLVPNASIIFGGSGANRTVMLIPAPNKNGSTVITVTVSDGTATASDTFNLSVSAVNDLPTISGIFDQQAQPNTSTGAIPVQVGDVETSASNLTLSGASSNTTLVPNANIVFGGSGANRTVTVTPASGQTGTALITVTVQDGNGATASASFELSVQPISDTIFGDSFEYGSLSAWTTSVTDGGNLSSSPYAKQLGYFGLEALINDATAIYVQDDSPSGEARYRMRLVLNPNSITMADGDNFTFFFGTNGASTQVLQAQLRRNGSTYQVRVAALDDNGTWQYSSYAPISDAPHVFELEWRAATAVGANNGRINWWLDENARTSVTGVDNDTRRIDRVRVGALAGIDAGTSGSIYIDDFVSRRSTYIGSIVSTPQLLTPQNGAWLPKPQTAIMTWSEDAPSIQYYLEIRRGTDNYDLGWLGPGVKYFYHEAPGTYTWRVKERAPGGYESAWSETRTFDVGPDRPYNLQSTAAGLQTVNLTWDPSSDAPTYVTGYEILRDGVVIGTSTTTSFTDTNAVKCATNLYTVRALMGTIPSEPSLLTAVTTFCDLIFSDGFEDGKLVLWTSNDNDGGDLGASGSAKLMGSYGMRAVIDDTTPIFVTDDTPYAEPRYRARFLFDPNTLAMANGDNFNVFLGFQGASTQVLQVQMRRNGGAYQVRVGAVDDGTTWSYTPFVTITDAMHVLEFDWQAATGNGANNGFLSWWLDGAAQTDVTNIDNDTRRIDRARWGAAGGIDAGTTGTMYFDAFVSHRETYIGAPSVAAPTLSSPSDGAQIARESGPTMTWSSVPGATEYYVEVSNGSDVGGGNWQSGTSWSLSSISLPQGLYYWHVKARSAAGEDSAWSEVRTFTVRPGVPTDLQGTATGLTQVQLTWTASIDAPDTITGYRIYRDGVQIGTTDNVTTTYTDTSAATCAANGYKVRSVNAGVSSVDSNAISVTTPCDAIFSDGFETGNLSAWSSKAIDGGDLAALAAAQLTSSTYGMRARINDGNDLYVQDDTPNAEARYRARFYFDPNTATMADNDRFTVFSGYQGASTPVVQIEMRKSGTAYQLRAGVRDDAANWTYTSYYTISDAPHIVEIDWQAATASAANDGRLRFWLDDSLKQTLSSIDNDTRRVDMARLGAFSGLDAGTSGVVYFDAFRSMRLSYIGAEVGGLGMIIEPEPTAEVTPEITPEATDEPTADVTPEATDEPTIEPTVDGSVTPTVEPSATPTVEPTLLPFSVPVFQTMDDGAPLWSASAGWLLSTDAAYRGLGWQAVASGNVETLSFNVPINLAGTSAPTLGFQSKLVSASLPEVQASVDGINWQLAASVTPSLNWALVSVDLSAYAGQTVLVRLVWASAAAGETWQVDEVTVSDGIAQPPIEPTLPPAQPTGEVEPTATPGAPAVEPPVYLPTTVPREGGSLPDAPADLPPAPAG